MKSKHKSDFYDIVVVIIFLLAVVGLFNVIGAIIKFVLEY